ncbi:DUF7008 domain-containing protein [Streptomyces sp. NPDC087844]|uniref:DUF7008 domain-containing protein n=1 Tax=Streptomyces sp. NPDC087844 TaxID=3365805 RepID=UPI00380E400A
MAGDEWRPGRREGGRWRSRRAAWPQAAPLRYKASGLAKHRVREETWEAQRQEDRRGLADGVHHSAPAPPRFTAVDFTKRSYRTHTPLLQP